MAPAALAKPKRIPGAFAVGVTESSSGAGRVTAIVNRNRVLYQDARGRWHHFDVDGYQINLAQLESGGGLAAWATREDTLVVRAWRGDGTLGAPQTVLTGIQPTYLSLTGENDQRAWGMADDGRGRVVIAAPSPDLGGWGGIYATTRDRGGAFSPRFQLLGPDPSPPAGIQDFGPPVVTISPIAADRTVTVSWSPWLTAGASLYANGYVTRDAGHWGAPVAGTPARDASKLVAGDSHVVSVGPRVRAFCRTARLGCEAKLFTWGDGTKRLALRHTMPDQPGHEATNADWGAGDGWFVARPDAHGRFDRPVLAARTADGPVWTPRPGVIGFFLPNASGLYLHEYRG